MDEHQQWKKVAHRLHEAAKRLSEAQELIEELPNTEHISGNLVPVREGVARFHSLATDKVVETNPKASTRPW